MKKTCLVIVSHGSKNKAWLKPINNLVYFLKRKHSKNKIFVAYLENTKPGLDSILSSLNNIKTINILPLFISCGNHVKKDIRKIILSYRKCHKNTTINLLPSVGENPDFQILVERIAKKHIC